MGHLPTAQTYEIRIGAELDAVGLDWFDGFDLTARADETVLRAVVVDQSALHGLLARIRDLSVPLLEVRRISHVGAQDATDPDASSEEE